MTSAKTQSFCRKHNIDLRYFNGKEIWPTNITEKTIALKIHENRFCLICKSNDISFNKAIEELKKSSKLLIMLYLMNMLKVALNVNPNLKCPIS